MAPAVDTSWPSACVPSTALLPLIGGQLNNLDEGEKQAIRSRWLTTEYSYGAPWRWVLLGLAAAVLILVAIAFAYVRLRRATSAQAKAERDLGGNWRSSRRCWRTFPIPYW